jgi:hypothetical protein
VDPETVVSAQGVTFEARRAALVARAAAEREAIAQKLAPLGALDTGFEKLRTMKAQFPAMSLGAGLGLSALLLVLPAGRSRLIRGGIAMFHLAGSVKRLLSPR